MILIIVFKIIPVIFLALLGNTYNIATNEHTKIILYLIVILSIFSLIHTVFL